MGSAIFREAAAWRPRRRRTPSPAIDVKRQAQQAERILLVAHDVGMRRHVEPSTAHEEP